MPPGDDGQVRADTPLEVLLASEPLRRFGALMAVDGEGRLRGVVTLEQVSRALQAHDRAHYRARSSGVRLHQWVARRQDPGPREGPSQMRGVLGLPADGCRGGADRQRVATASPPGRSPCLIFVLALAWLASGGPRLVVARHGRPRRPRAHAGSRRDARPRRVVAQPARLIAGGRVAPRCATRRTGRTTYRLARHARTRRPHHRRRPGRPARRASPPRAPGRPSRS